MREMKASACVPSFTHSYSLGTEFISKWFFNHFSDNFFKSVHIEGKHVLDDFRKFNFHNLIKKGKPAVAILPRITFDYNRDWQDTNMYGLDYLIHAVDLDKRSFIKNFEKNTFIALLINQLDIRYTFKIRLESRAQQIDLYRYMVEAFRIGHTETVTIDGDFHIPYGVMMQFAKDNGYTIENNRIQNIDAFLKFVNMKSELPITFKLRTVNGKMEFFLRFQNIDMYIDLQTQLSVDDGERQGMLDNNFNIELEVGLKMPAPRMFIYYSDTTTHEYISSIESIGENDRVIYNICTLEIKNIPDVNEKGWNQFLITEYHDEELPSEIDMSELFDAMDCKEIIEHNNTLGIDSSIFIEFKLYNEDYLIPYSVDWTTKKIKFLREIKAPNTKIALYMDTAYYAEQLDIYRELKKSRLY